MRTIDIGKEFSSSLVNRNSQQRDGKFSGEEFRDKYLSDLMNPKSWENKEPYITLDFTNVERIGPGWANEVFSNLPFYSVEDVLNKIILKNISKVKLAIIINEIVSGSFKEIIETETKRILKNVNLDV